jgi:hypothetical protein
MWGRGEARGDDRSLKGWGWLRFGAALGDLTRSCKGNNDYHGSPSGARWISVRRVTPISGDGWRPARKLRR